MNRLHARMRRSPVAFGLMISAAASAAVPVPKQADICAAEEAVPGTRVVDRGKLVAYLLDAQPVSRRLEDWASLPANRSGQWADLTPRERMIADKDVCENNAACAPSDANNLRAARQMLVALLTQFGDAYSNPGEIADPRIYFATAGAELLCRRSGGEPVEAPGAIRPKYSYDFPLRIRGTAESLLFARGDESGFKAAEKASLAFTDDGIAEKKTEKLAVVAGYPIIVSDKSLHFAEIIPYVGWNRSAAKVAGQAQTVSADLWRFGLMFDYMLTGPEPGSRDAAQMSHWFSARPEYLWNDKDGSEVASLNLTYMPVINGALNDYIPLVRGKRLLSIRPIVDLRFNNGIFVDAGARLPAAARDYSRVGAQIGLALTSDHPNFPVDLTVTDTYMYALAGRPKSLNQFKSVLSLAFDPKRYFGVEVSYVHGRREDVADRESVWTIGLTFKY